MSLRVLVRDDTPVTGVLTRAAAVPAGDWDALTGPAAFYSSRAWVRGLEDIHGQGLVLTAFRASRLTGVVPTWHSRDTRGLFCLADMTAPLPGPWEQQMLWLGTNRGTANALTITRAPGTRQSTLRTLLEGARGVAAAEGLSGVVWPYLSGDAAREVAACHPLAQTVLHSADAIVAVPGNGMEGLEAAATSKDRRTWRREQRLFHAHSAIEWTALSPPVIQLIAPLLARTRDKYGSAGGRRWVERALTGQLSSGAAASAVVALARPRHDTEVAAAAVYYHRGDWLYGRYWGAQGDGPGPYAYFNLTHYAAVDYAARHGVRHLHLSVPASPSKTARTARPSPLALVLFPTGPTPLIDQGLLQEHNDHFARQWWTRSRTARQAPPDAAWRTWMLAQHQPGHQERDALPHLHL
ncbi:peptidogalycan biosysnthesis protein [Streptomyces umbrinus]|uniref:peptidogalycan biosysnthesis protein n=1 Tax=Streptomyces umbrinus TaxID=67370 RepID=UPI003407459E